LIHFLHSITCGRHRDVVRNRWSPDTLGYEMLVFAQFSDTHLDGSSGRTSRAIAVMEYLNALTMPLDAIVVTGDIADHGLPAEYEQARAIFSSSRHPVFPCPGNHDARAAYRAALLGEDGDPTILDEDGGSPVNRVHHTAGALFALCDSTVPGRDDGYLADETISWLDGVLAERPGVPSFLCFHHPPVPLHSPYPDSVRLFGEDRVGRLVNDHPQVAAILCGHAHTPAATTFAGRPLLVAPGVVSTLVLPWEHGEIADEQAPVAVAFHILDEQQRLTTHYRVVTSGGSNGEVQGT
jgi:Icc protein